jgi:hypothetical protein
VTYCINYYFYSRIYAIFISSRGSSTSSRRVLDDDDDASASESPLHFSFQLLRNVTVPFALRLFALPAQAGLVRLPLSALRSFQTRWSAPSPTAATASAA